MSLNTIMKDLKDKKCVPCEGGAESLKPEEVKKLSLEVPEWSAVQNRKIEKDFEFKNFKEALDFVNAVGKIAEEEGHHPDIFLHQWNKVKISLTTHAIAGLSENDFITASKIDVC